MKALAFALALSCVAVLGCGGETPTAGDDSGTTPGMDAGRYPDGAVVPPEDTGIRIDAPGIDTGCVPGIEICGDHIDQDCNGRDVSCGDNDHDGTQACRPTDTDLTQCDCDDTRMDVRPAVGSVPGAPEVCDGVDNNCNGRIDESAECCAGCASLGTDRGRADVCDESGACDCSTEPGTGPCAAGEACCSAGCTNTQTDLMNCGFCNSACTDQADNCSGGTCHCGSGPVCDFINMCTAGAC